MKAIKTLDIENLIFSRYKYRLLTDKITEESQKDDTKKELIQLLQTHLINNDFFSNVFMQNFDECAKYLGLASSGKSLFYVNFYVNGEKFVFKQNGIFMKYVFQENEPYKAGLGTAFINGRCVITEKEINIFNEFLANLRIYWKENFSKRKIFRGNLSEKLEFRELLNS